MGLSSDLEKEGCKFVIKTFNSKYHYKLQSRPEGDKKEGNMAREENNSRQKNNIN